MWDTYPRTFTETDWPGYSTGWLTFECIECDPPEEKRRLSPVPDGWSEQPEAELRRLLHGAELITPLPQA